MATPSPTPTTDPCVDNPLAWAGCIIKDVTKPGVDFVNGVGGAVSFAQDPGRWTFDQLKSGAQSLANDVLPALTTAIQPDLTADFFINAYRISFAAAIFVMVLVAITLAYRTGKGHLAGRDLVQSLAQYGPMFIIGSMFGPLIGMTLVGVFHELTNSVISWGFGNAQKILDGLLALLNKIDPAATPGGIFVAIGLMFLMLIGLLIVLVILLCQLVTLYFTGVMIPLCLVLIMDPDRRRLGLGVVGLWVGILASHPVLFFLLGVAFSMVGENFVTLGQKDGLKTLVNFIVSLIAIYMAVFSPLLLMKFFPILQQAFVPSGGGGGNGGSDIGPSNATEATNQYGNGGSETSQTTTDVTTNDDGSTTTTTTTDTATDQTLSEAAATNESTPETSQTAPQSAGEGAGAAEAAEGAEATEETAAATAEAGAAESATGAGAAVGIPTLILAAAESAKSGADAAVNQATAPMENNSWGGN